MSLFENIMKDFSEETNLEVKIESDNSCAFEFEDLLIVLQYRQAADDIVMFCSLSDPEKIPVFSKEVLYKALSLSFNGEGTGGNFIGISEGTLILSRIIPIEQLDGKKLMKTLSEFSDKAVFIRDVLKDVYSISKGDEDLGTRDSAKSSVASSLMDVLPV